MSEPLLCRDYVELAPKALERWPEMARYRHWRICRMDYDPDRFQPMLVTARGIADWPDGWHPELDEVPTAEITAPPDWFRKAAEPDR